MTTLERPRPEHHQSAPAAQIAPDERRHPPPSVLVYLHDLRGGGAERQCLTLVRELRARGMTLELVLHQARGELVDQVPPGIRVVNLDRKKTRNDVVPLARYVRQHEPDILLANVDHINIAATVARMLSMARTKVVITQHNTLFEKFATDGWEHRIVAPLYRLLAPFISAAVAVSDGIARELITRAGLPQGKVVRIYNAVIGPGFQERANLPAVHPWFCDGMAPVYVTAARLVPQKDQETLLRAMAIYRQNGGQGRLLVLGSGPLREHLENLAHELGIATAVDFVGFQDNPLPWFRRSDVFVLSSRTEGFGIALAEAMGCGTPVISTDSGHGPSEILAQGRYGVLVPPQDPGAMAAALGAAGRVTPAVHAGVAEGTGGRIQQRSLRRRIRVAVQQACRTAQDGPARL